MWREEVITDFLSTSCRWNYWNLEMKRKKSKAVGYESAKREDLEKAIKVKRRKEHFLLNCKVEMHTSY
jgi:hypothetical protein